MVINPFERHDEHGGVSRIEDTEVGLSHTSIDKYTYSAEEHKVGVSFQMQSAVKILIYAWLD